MAFLLCALAGVSAASAWAQTEAHVYAVKHRRAEELLPLARTALGAGGNAEVDARTNSIVLIGEAGAIGRARAILTAQDVALRTVVLEYEQHTLGGLSARGFRVDWSVAGTSYRIGNVLPSADGSFLALRAGGGESAREERLAGTLRVMEGSAGRIHTGSAVPIVIRHRRGVSTQVVSAVSGFEATPRILGDGRVELALEPFDDRLEGGGAISVSGAATTLVVNPGEPVIVGAIGRGISGTASSYGGGASASAASERVLVITVEIE